jgi:hypothetical protein
MTSQNLIKSYKMSRGLLNPSHLITILDRSRADGMTTYIITVVLIIVNQSRHTGYSGREVRTPTPYSEGPKFEL